MTNTTNGSHASALPRPLRYHPAASGRYEIRPGLVRLNSSPPAETVDEHLFQFDDQAARYRAAKLSARKEELSKYVCPTTLPEPSAGLVVRCLVERLSAEYPQWFALNTNVHGGYTLTCRITAEQVELAPDFSLLGVQSRQPVDPPYSCAWDAIACQVQEDLCLVDLVPHAGDKVHALHVCLPNHWAPVGKLGQDFGSVHRPVPHMARINRNATRLLALPRDGATFERFAWGLATDDRLNHHPEPPPGTPESEWRGRSFDPLHPRLFVRTERQTLSAVAGTSLILFTIRTYLDDVRRYTAEQRLALAKAIASMSEEAAAYKGLSEGRAAIVSWLNRA